MRKSEGTSRSASEPGRRRSSRAAVTPAALPDLSQYGRLAEYNRKRHFGVTPEPAGKAAPRQAGQPLEFVVQKHRASRLHYDFRLEHGGVMLSWAVPKGPALDPAVKRLAMETEPHPMDYNQFEGVIPEGEYGGGVVMIWDKGIWAPIAPTGLGDEAEVERQLKKGDLKFVLLGEKLAGSWVLVRTRGTRQWLLIKHQDEYVSHEDVTTTLPLSAVAVRALAAIAEAARASPRQLRDGAATAPPGAVAAPEGRPRRSTTTRAARPRARSERSRRAVR